MPAGLESHGWHLSSLMSSTFVIETNKHALGIISSYKCFIFTMNVYNHRADITDISLEAKSLLLNTGDRFIESHLRG